MSDQDQRRKDLINQIDALEKQIEAAPPEEDVSALEAKLDQLVAQLQDLGPDN